MSDEKIRQELKRAFAAAEGEPPQFADVWAAAASRHASARRRIRLAAGVAATVALSAIVVGLWPERQAGPTGEFLIAESLMNSTSWQAPSDSLLPQHRFDVYREIPLRDMSTDSREGALL